MEKEQIKYRRLPGTRRAHVRFTRLFLGPDHLLMIETTGYVENYKRFYFRDIQAIAIRKTRHAFIGNCCLGALLLLEVAALLAYFSSPDQEIAILIPLLFVTVTTAVGLIVNALAGTSCICHIRTAVQTERLAPLNRVRKAKKALAALETLIHEVQGEPDDQEIRNRLQNLTAPVPAVSSVSNPQP